MSQPRPPLSVSEAASVTGVPLKKIHRIVDQGLLDGAVENRAGARMIADRGLVGLKLAYEAASLLSPNGRRRLVKRLLQKPAARTVEENPLSVDVRPLETSIRRGLLALEKSRKMVAVDRDVMGGTPCFKGTRIPVYDIAAMLANGEQKSAILKAYPRLTPEQVDLAVVYAEAYPRRGRPRRKPAWHKAPPISSEKLSLRDLPQEP